MRIKITKADVANIGGVLAGVILYNSGIPVVQTVGGFLFSGAAVVGIYRTHRKAKAKKKEAFFL